MKSRFDKRLGRKLVDALHLTHFADVVRTVAEDCVEIVECVLLKHQVEARHSVIGIDIFNIFPYERTLDVVFLKVGHRHDNDISIHQHHHADQGNRPDVINLNARMIH